MLVSSFGTFTSNRVSQSLVHGFHVLVHDFFALLAVGVANRLPDCLDRLSGGKTLEMAKKHTCRIVFMRLPMPGITRHLIGVDHVEFRSLRNDLLLH